MRKYKALKVTMVNNAVYYVLPKTEYGDKFVGESAIANAIGHGGSSLIDAYTENKELVIINTNLVVSVQGLEQSIQISST